MGIKTFSCTNPRCLTSKGNGRTHEGACRFEFDPPPVNSYPDEVARQWKTERDELIRQLEIAVNSLKETARSGEPIAGLAARQTLKEMGIPLGSEGKNDKG